MKIIIPTIDTELIALAKRKEVFFQSGIEIIISDLSFIMQCREKEKFMNFSIIKKSKLRESTVRITIKFHFSSNQ